VNTTWLTTRWRAQFALVAILCAILSTTLSGAAQEIHDFTFTIDPLPSCAPDASISGTVTLTGLSAGYGVYVQLLGDGEILDGQAFEGHDGYPDGAYDWTVTGDLPGPHQVLELFFSIHDGEGELIRDETVLLTPDCATPAAASPAAQPVTEQPATPVSTAPVFSSPVTSLPVTGSGGTTAADVWLVLTFTLATVLGLVALAVLDRRPQE
jgi:hypothetical protein